MATIIPCIVLSRPNVDGTYTIKLKITNGNRVSYITTDFVINANQWNGSMVMRHNKAFEINAKLSQILNEYQRRLEELDPRSDMSASQIKKLLEQGDKQVNSNSTGDLIPFVNKFISKLQANNQTSYAQNMGYTLKSIISFFGEHIRFKDINLNSIELFEQHLRQQGQSDTTINIRMTHLKAIINNAITCGEIEYKIFPFRGYSMPDKNVRDICISKEELIKIRDAEFRGLSARRLSVARDLFMLSFYCAGINLTDILSAKFNRKTNILTYIRKKTATRKRGAHKEVSITIQPEAYEIIDRYITEDDTLDMGYKFADYKQFRSFVTKSLNRIGKEFGFEKTLMFYSARKTFCQFGYELGVPFYVLEYAIGQTIKDAHNRPIYNYIKIMRSQADEAIRMILDYSFDLENN